MLHRPCLVNSQLRQVETFARGSYVFVLKTSSISLLYPVYTGLSVVFVFIAGQLFFGEEPVIMQQLGAAFVIGGIILLGKG